MWLIKGIHKIKGWTLAFFVVLGVFGTSGFAKDKEKEEQQTDTGKGVSAFGKFLPLNRVNEGVKIPSFDGSVRAALVTARKLKRIDADNLELDDMVIETFTPDGATDSRITLVRAWFHMPSSTLISRTRSKIQQPNFQIEGDRLVFDTRSRRGRMAGNVEMLIYDVKAFGKTQLKTGNAEETAVDGEIDADGS